LRIDAQIPGAIGPEHWFAQAFASALGEVAEALDLGGGAGPLEVHAGVAQPDKWAEWTDPLWHSHSWTPGESAGLWIGCPRSVAQALWSHIGGPGDSPQEALETFREMLNQSSSTVAAEASSRLGATVQAAAAEQASAPESGWAVELHFKAAGGAQTVAVVGNVGLAAALNPPAAEEPSPVAAPLPSQPGPKTPSPAETPRDPLELIREVYMELAVSFGDTTMPLADVLKLTSGAIVELNRSVSDPVEVLVNGSVIARGDVVVVDGNYGVRITEIVSRRDRVRSML